MTQLPMLKNGSKSDVVKGLKNALMVRSGESGLFDRPLSDDFGPKTDAAVKSFQRNADLDDDGVVGPKTWEALVVYVVQPGDTLGGIAGQRLGEPNRWREIFQINNELVSDPDELSAGQVLTLPPGAS